MSRIPKSKLVGAAHHALQAGKTDRHSKRVTHIANTMAARREQHKEWQIQELQADFRESEPLKILQGASNKLVSPELAYLHSYHRWACNNFNNHSNHAIQRNLTDGSALLAKQKLIPSSENLNEAQEEHKSHADRRGQLVDILV